MPTIKNLSSHVEDDHNGRAIPAYATATISKVDLDLPHYQQRIAAGVFVVADERLNAAQHTAQATKAAEAANKEG